MGTASRPTTSGCTRGVSFRRLHSALRLLQWMAAFLVLGVAAGPTQAASKAFDGITFAKRAASNTLLAAGGVPSFCPTNKTVECGSVWTFDDPTSAGPCSATTPPTITVLTTVTNSLGCLFAVTRTWQVSDVCGNSATCSQTVTVADTTPPVATCASDKTVQCSSAWTFDTPTATDTCCGTNISIAIFSTTTNGTCPPTITRTWQVTDCCSNHVFCSQTITALDTTPPTITCAPNKTVLLGSLITFDAPIATDTCCGTNITITILSTVTNASPCGQAITRTWTATDCCGNSANCSQTVTVSQTSPPQITSVYVPCGGSKVTISFSRPISAASALNIAHYAITCSGVSISVTQAVLAASQIVCLYLAQPVGSACFISVSNIQDACGNTVPSSTQPLTCTAQACASGSSGNEYWLTFPGNHGPDPADAPQPHLFIAGPAGTVGNVAIPGLAVPFSMNFTIPAGANVTVALPRAADLGDANDLVQTNGIHVIASQPVTVYGLNYARFSSDGYLGLATTALGTSYRVLAYKNLFPEAPELAGSQFAVVGTVDGTTVTIVPPLDVGVHAAGLPFNVLLMKGETYQLRQTTPTSDDLSGALVLADQPIAVFGSHLCANIPDTNVFFCDHLVEQLPPTSSWGTNFLTVRLASRLHSDGFRFMALLTNTIVRTNGVPLPNPLDPGQFAEVQLAANSQITADKPILVAQYANSSDFDLVQLADPFMTLIPPTSLYGTSYIIHAPANFPANFINLTVALSGITQISLDGTLIPSGQFSAIGASGYAAARIPVAGGQHTLSSSASPFGAIVYGWSQYNAYGYPAGLCSPSVTTPPVNFSCPPGSLILQAGSNCAAVVPDLTTQVGNATAALLITQSPASGTVVGPGNYTITITIIDQYGQPHLCVIALTVLPSGASGLQCPPNIVTNCASRAGRIVSFQATSCNPALSLSCNPPSGSLFPPGVTTVTCTANGPSPAPQCSFTVTVNCLVLTIAPQPLAGTSQIILWPGNGMLYQAVNVQGPYLPLPGVTSPYTNRAGGRGFFRVGP